MAVSVLRTHGIPVSAHEDTVLHTVEVRSHNWTEWSYLCLFQVLVCSSHYKNGKGIKYVIHAIPSFESAFNKLKFHWFESTSYLYICLCASEYCVDFFSVSRFCTLCLAAWFTLLSVHVCDSNPCLNGGKCVTRKAGYYWAYQCICSFLYKGENCESKLFYISWMWQRMPAH